MEGPREMHKDTRVHTHTHTHTLLTHQARHTFQTPADAHRLLTAQVYGHSEGIKTHTHLHTDTWKQAKTQIGKDYILKLEYYHAHPFADEIYNCFP